MLRASVTSVTVLGALLVLVVSACPRTPAISPGRGRSQPKHFRVELTITPAAIAIQKVIVGLGQARAYGAPPDDFHATVLDAARNPLAELALYDPLRRRVYGPMGDGRAGPREILKESYVSLPEATLTVFVPFDAKANTIRFQYRKARGASVDVPLAPAIAEFCGRTVDPDCPGTRR